MAESWGAASEMTKERTSIDSSDGGNCSDACANDKIQDEFNIAEIVELYGWVSATKPNVLALELTWY